MTPAITATGPNKSWRRVALTGWAVLALLFMAFYLIDLSLDYNQLLSPCEGPDCNYLAISAAEVKVLASWGLSTRFYAVTMSGLSVISVTVFWLLAGLILWRQPDFRIGLAISLTLMAMPVTAIADTDNVAANYPALTVPSLALSALGTVLILLFLYLVPNGRFVPRWAVIPLVAAVLFTISVELILSGVIDLSPEAVNLLFMGVILLITLGFLSQVYRYLKVSSPTERLQTRWVLFGLLFMVLGLPIWAFFFGGLVELPAGEVRLLGSLGGWLLSNMTTIALPIAVAIAITRYRLWNIDLIIRKTLIYLLLTASLFLVYLGIVVLLQSLFSALLGDRYTALVTVISTLVVAALFNPLRRRIQDLIDRRFFRQKYNKEKVLAAFSSTLRDEVDLERLQNSMLAVVEETMRPASLSLWLRDAEQTELSTRIRTPGP